MERRSSPGDAFKQCTATRRLCRHLNGIILPTLSTTSAIEGHEGLVGWLTDAQHFAVSRGRYDVSLDHSIVVGLMWLSSGVAGSCLTRGKLPIWISGTSVSSHHTSKHLYSTSNVLQTLSAVTHGSLYARMRLQCGLSITPMFFPRPSRFGSNA